MTIVMHPPAAILTYEEYMVEPQVEGRYDIVEGVRIFMPGATFRHRRVSKNITNLLPAFEINSGIGLMVAAPYDVLIRRLPRLQTRQPDALFISHTRLALGGGIPQVGPLPIAPELVIEIISDSETQRILEDKIADYAAIGVDECWVIRPETQTIEFLQPGQSGSHVIEVFDQTAPSRVFLNLSVAVADVFRD